MIKFVEAKSAAPAGIGDETESASSRISFSTAKSVKAKRARRAGTGGRGEARAAGFEERER